MSRLPQEAWLLRWNNNRSALTDEFKLREGNSDPIKVHPELNCIFSLRPCVCVLATEVLSKISVATTRMHLILLLLAKPYLVEKYLIRQTHNTSAEFIANVFMVVPSVEKVTFVHCWSLLWTHVVLQEKLPLTVLQCESYTVYMLGKSMSEAKPCGDLCYGDSTGRFHYLITLTSL